MSKHRERCISSDIDLSCSVRGGEGAFEEVKGGDKQVSLAKTNLSIFHFFRKETSRYFLLQNKSSLALPFRSQFNNQ